MSGFGFPQAGKIQRLNTISQFKFDDRSISGVQGQTRVKNKKKVVPVIYRFNQKVFILA
jgi:hypothetical protein